jgi:two-component system, NarL family, response regulator NreC
MRILLVDDHPLFRQGLRALLEEKDTIEVVGEANDGAEAVDLTIKLAPDVVIMDISMPGYCGLDATKQIKEHYPNTKVIILSGHSDNIYVNQALKAGASGYVHKDAVYDELAIALDAVKKDRPYLSPTVLQPLVTSYINASPAAGAMNVYNKLTAREKEVFSLIVKDRSRNAIAETLHISPKTVDRHRSNLLEKLNLRKEGEILEFARLVGLTGS